MPHFSQQNTQIQTMKVVPEQALISYAVASVARRLPYRASAEFDKFGDGLGLPQALSISADSRTVLEVMPRKFRFWKEDADCHREEVLNLLTRVIGAINTVKDLVPLAIGKTILSAASTILLAIRVNLWSIIETGR
jgi:hypothetical protein